MDIPTISEAVSLPKVLQNWDNERKLFFMDETGGGNEICEVFAADKGKKAAILVGPEGGFAPDELDLLRKMEAAKAVSLGPRILRAETAVAAALACWKAIAGDWSAK